MIEVKGTRTENTETAASRERYVFGDAQSLNKAPLFVAGLIAGLFAYLKVALSRSSPAEPEKADATPPKTTKKPLAEEENPLLSQGGNRSDRPSPPEPEFSDVLPFPVRPYRLVVSAPLDYPAAPWEGRGNAVAPQVAATAGNDNGPADAGGTDALAGSAPTAKGEQGGEHRDGAAPPRPDAPETRRNKAPAAAGPVLLSDILVGQVVLLTAAQFLAGAADADGDTLLVRNLTVVGGTLEARADGWIFRSGRDAAPGEVRISYDVSDGATSIHQTATFQLLKPPPMLGTRGDDILLGSEAADEIAALGGDDIVDARGGRRHRARRRWRRPHHCGPGRRSRHRRRWR